MKREGKLAGQYVSMKQVVGKITP